MKKSFSITWTVFICAVTLIFAVVFVNAQDDVTTVSDSGFTTEKRPTVRFMHDLHNENAGIDDCNACHHVYANGTFMEDDSSEEMECSECHDKGGDDKLARVYHLRCKGCHEKEKAGPVMCVECHKKQIGQ